MNRSQQQTKLWLMPEFDNLELFRASEIHYSYSRHSHPGYSLGVIEAGVGGNSYRGCTYLAPPGSIIFMNPEEAHTGYSGNDLPLTYRMLYPSIELVRQIAQDCEAAESLYFNESVVNHDALAQKIRHFHAVLEQASDPISRQPDRLRYQSLLVEVFTLLFAQYSRTSLRSIAPEHRSIDLIKQYLHDNLHTSISLDQLVEITHLNRSYLIRVFRQAVGMPPYTYLNQIRIAKAKQLLAQNQSIASVAIAVGLSDQSHLTRHFKQIVGVTPGQYQKSTSFKTA